MEYDIVTLKRKMLVKFPSFGRITSNVDFIEDKNVETAETDGKNIYYNPDFLKSLDSVEKQVFLLAHEVCHIAFDHIKRQKDKNNEIWNIAADAVINQQLIDNGLEMIEGGIDIKEAINYDSETMYEKLLSENENKEKTKQSSSGNTSTESKGKTGHASHGMWSKTLEKEPTQKEEKQKSKKSLFDKLFNRNGKEEKSELEKAQEEFEKLGEMKVFEENANEKRKKLEEMKRETAKKSMNPGLSSNGAIRKIKDIGVSKNIIDWRYVLREAINYSVDWSYNNAEIEDGVMIPNLEEVPISETEILLDTSGSISENLLKNFLRETKNILGVSKVRVGCFDTNFYGFQEIRSLEDIDDMVFQGGGGTNFQVAVNAFSNRVENKIIFTDGKATMPTNVVNAIWIVFGGNTINPPGGRVIYINDEQLNDLCSYNVSNGFRK